MRLLFFSAMLICLLLYAVQTQAIEGFPGKTWGELQRDLPLDSRTINNSLLQGWIEQGIYWFSWNDLKLNTYGNLRYNWDEKGLDWDNTVGPGVGIALEKFFPKGAFVRGAVEYDYDRLWRSGTTNQKAIIYFSWYGWWDLGKSK